MSQKTGDDRLLTGLYFRLLPYQILLLVINAVNGIVDSLCTSNFIGTTAMSAIGLFAPFNHFLYAASIAFVGGSQILYGRYLAKERERINGLFSLDLVLSGGLSLLTVAGLVLLVVTGATRMFVSAQPNLQMLNDYILGQAIGIPGLVLGQQLFAFLSMENQKRRTMAASIACIVVNAALDYLFISQFSMGTFGLGLASSLSTWVFLGVQAIYYLKGRSEWKFSLRALPWKDASQIVRLGYPGALSRFVEMFRCLIVNQLLLAVVGSAALSSFAASNSLLAVFWSVPFGMMAVSRMLFSISIGEEDRLTMVQTMKIALTRCVPLMCAIAAVLILLAEPLTRLFYRDPSDPVYGMTVMGFRLLPLCMPPAVISLNYACYAQTAEKKVMSIVLPVIDGMVGVVLFSLILIPTMKMNGLYIANILNGLLCFAVTLIGARISIGHFPRSIEEYMAIPPHIGVGPDERIDITVTDMEQVLPLSRQVTDFCLQRGIDRRRAQICGLCMEEMAGNVVEHGFSADRKKHQVVVRVTHKEGEVILRIRDNCRAFNPWEYSRLMDMDDLGKNVGIRLVFNIAGKVSYQCVLGMNVLTIRV